MGYREDVRTVKALADENRLTILRMLQSGEKCASAILEELNITQPTRSHHMKTLCDAGIADWYKEGKWGKYSLPNQGSMNLRNLVAKYTLTEKYGIQ
ncbi:MAG: metalloregulator ArsR/SmtB family transcription factor [bacterium]|nr:metalloregulator ArsR/SmtB family transcription factor [bacterium]